MDEPLELPSLDREGIAASLLAEFRQRNWSAEYRALDRSGYVNAIFRYHPPCKKRRHLRPTQEEQDFLVGQRRLDFELVASSGRQPPSLWVSWKACLPTTTPRYRTTACTEPALTHAIRHATGACERALRREYLQDYLLRQVGRLVADPGAVVYLHHDLREHQLTGGPRVLNMHVGSYLDGFGHGIDRYKTVNLAEASYTELLYWARYFETLRTPERMVELAMRYNA